MQPHSRNNSLSTGAARFTPSPFASNTPARAPRATFQEQVDALIDLIKEQENEATRLRDSGQTSAAIDKYRSVIRLCDEASRKVGSSPMDSLWSHKRDLMIQAMNTLQGTFGYTPASQRTDTQFALPKLPPVPSTPSLPVLRAPSAGSGVDARASKSTPPSGTAGMFREPVTKLDVEHATLSEYTNFTDNLKAEADSLGATDVQAAIAKLREAADIWNYAANSPRFQFLERIRASARKVADRYIEHVQALQNRGGALAAVDGPASSQAETAELDRRVRNCIVKETPTNQVQWSKIIGAKGAKDALQSALIDRYIYGGDAENEARGVLLYGPAGTGKTMLVRGVVNLVSSILTKRAQAFEEKQRQRAEQDEYAVQNATEDSNSQRDVSENKTQDNVAKAITLFKVTAADCESKWVGDGTKFMKVLFEVAREKQPSVIFIDEADALFSKRGEGQHEAAAKIMTQFMQELEGLTSSGNITVIAASNVPDKIDDAVLRRLQHDVYVPVPQPEERAKILEQLLGGMPYPSNVPTDALRALALSKDMHNFTGADIVLMLKKAKSMGEQMLHDAEAFKEVDGAWEPCDPTDPGAQVGDYTELFQTHCEVHFRRMPITLEHLQKVAREHRPTASKQIPVLEKWKADLEASKS